jgi:CO dehydrogenase nickel-insertion accessory protein CooC1
LELWKQYQELSKTSGTYDSLFVVINKVEENDDVDFVKNLISKDKILGFLTISKYIKNIEKY